MARHVEAMVGFMDAGAEVFDYGNSIRGEAQLAGYERAFDFPGFVPAYIRPLFCEGKGPFRWAALSGEAVGHRQDRPGDARPLPGERVAAPLDQDGRRARPLPGPARPHLLARLRRARPGRASASTTWSACGELAAPLVIGRDHLDCGSVASPYRETEAMLDGSDAIADWPLLNAMVNVASGASWVSIHHGGGVGMGRSIHAGQVTVADGTKLAGEKIRRVLTNDPGMGVIRHVDAGLRHRGVGRGRARRAGPDAGGRRVTSDAVQSAAGTPAVGRHRRGRRTRSTEMWRDLAPIGRDADTGGYRRYAWTGADADCRAWFRAQAETRGLAYEVDRNGNQWAWLGDPTSPR